MCMKQATTDLMLRTGGEGLSKVYYLHSSGRIRVRDILRWKRTHTHKEQDRPDDIKTYYETQPGIREGVRTHVESTRKGKYRV